MFPAQLMVFALSRALDSAGIKIEASIAMIAITTSSYIRVKEAVERTEILFLHTPLEKSGSLWTFVLFSIVVLMFGTPILFFLKKGHVRGTAFALPCLSRVCFRFGAAGKHHDRQAREPC